MKVLALDTSSIVASVAVMNDGILLGEYTLNHNKTHSQKLVPIIQQLLSDLELEPFDIDLFAVSKGPGSFTGLRIAITTAKAMAYALDKPIIGVPTLDILAHNISFCQHLICPIMDARNNRVYTALYKWILTEQESEKKSEQKRLTEYMGIKIEELVETIWKSIDKNKEKVVFVGDGVMTYKPFFSKELDERCIFAPNNLLLQRASSVAEIALNIAYRDNEINKDNKGNNKGNKDNKDNKDNCFNIVPFYLRKSQAERAKGM